MFLFALLFLYIRDWTDIGFLVVLPQLCAWKDQGVDPIGRDIKVYARPFYDSMIL